MAKDHVSALVVLSFGKHDCPVFDVLSADTHMLPCLCLQIRLSGRIRFCWVRPGLTQLHHCPRHEARAGGSRQSPPEAHAVTYAWQSDWYGSYYRQACPCPSASSHLTPFFPTSSPLILYLFSLTPHCPWHDAIVFAVYLQIHSVLAVRNNVPFYHTPPVAGYQPAL